MGKGAPYTPVGSLGADFDKVQVEVRKVFDQLDLPRRGLLAGANVQKAGDYQIGEDAVIEYIGPGGNSFTVPDPALLGALVSQVLFIANGGGGNLTIRAPGSVKVAGAATITLAAGNACCLFSNGVKTSGKWYRVT